MDINLLEIDDTRAFAQLDKLVDTLEKVSFAGEDAGKTISEGMQEAEQAVKEFNTTMQKSTEEVTQQSEAVKANNKNLTTWKDSIKQTVSGVQVAGKTGGEWKDKLQETRGALQGAETGATGFGGAIGKLSNIIKVSAIGLLITIVAKLIQYFTTLQPVVDKVSAVFAGIRSVIDTLVKRVALLGAGIFSFITGNFSEGIQQMSDSVTGLGTALADAAMNAYELEKRTQALRDAQIESSVIFARQRAQLDALREAGQDETLSIRDRINAIRQAGEVEARLNERRLSEAKEARDIINEQVFAEKVRLEQLIRGGAEAADIARQQRAAERERANSSAEDRQKLAEAEIAVIEAQAESDKIRRDNEKELREIRAKASAERKKQLDDEAKALLELAKSLERLKVETTPEGIDRDIAATEKKYDELQAIVAKGVETLAKIEKRRELTPQELEQRAQLQQFALQLEARRVEALKALFDELAEKEAEAKKKEADRLKKLSEEALKRQVEEINERKKLGEQGIELARVQGEGLIKRLQAAGASEKKVSDAKLALQKLIHQKEIENEIAHQEALLAIEKDPNRAKTLAASLAVLREELKNLEIPEPKGKPKSIWNLFGIEDPEIEGGLQEITKQVISAIEEIQAAQLKAAEERTKLAQKRVDDAQAALDKELELEKQGVRNNLNLRKEQLAAEKVQRDKALKEEARAKRAQILLDSAQQASSLYTAAANIYKSLSALGPFGIAAAVGLISFMVGSFLKAKGDALKATRPQQLRKGKKIIGPSHENGGVEFTGIDGNRYEAEGDEWLIGTRPSREHDKFLDRLNRNEFAGVDLNRRLSDSMSDQAHPVSEASGRTESLRSGYAAINSGGHFLAMIQAYREGTEKVAREIRRKPVIKPWKEGYIEVVDDGNIRDKNTVLPQ